MYLIRSHDHIYQSGTPWSIISCFHSGHSLHLPDATLPFRTISIILNDSSESSPFWIRYIIISSRVHIAVEIVAFPSLIRVCALPSHTSVPCASPAIRTRSEKYCGLVSISICIAKSVPNSGIPSAPNFVPPISSGLIPSAEVFWNSDITSLESSGISRGSIPVKSCNIRIIVGSRCPKISSFNKLWSILW